MNFEGQKIILRNWQESDFEPYINFHKPDQKWQELDGPYYEKPTVESRRGIVEKLRQRLLDNNFPEPYDRLLIADKGTDALVGIVSSYWISRETDWLANGIVIFDEDLWGQGLGYEALGLWNEYLLAAYPKIVRLDLRTWSGNHGMMALALKLGYQEEARFRRARIVRGEYYDSMGYGILREGWQGLYPAGFAHHLLKARTHDDA